MLFSKQLCSFSAGSADFADYFVCCCDTGESIGQIQETGQMHFLALRACGVGQKKRPEVSNKGVASGGFAAQIGHHAAYDKVFDF